MIITPLYDEGGERVHAGKYDRLNGDGCLQGCRCTCRWIPSFQDVVGDRVSLVSIFFRR